MSQSVPFLGSSTQQGGELQPLWEDGERVFSRGQLNGDERRQRPVLVVRAADDRAPPALLDRFAHEYGLRDVLIDAPVLVPLALERDGNKTLLLLEDFNGEPLSQLLGEPIEVGIMLRIAIAICAAVGVIHRRGLVHKDLKPANIVVDIPSGQVRLTGFGITSRLPRERQFPEPPETIAGTLPYMAPEQTGRMNRSIDSRSDLYALGVTLYQMATGSLPFFAHDPMEWVHCHIARKPTPPIERLESLPSAISAIILKLLAKIAEERYQTASGVERDLRRCLHEWEAGGHIRDFPLAREDTPDRLLIPERLYGRDREVEALMLAFDRVVGCGEPELVLVSGYSGIGKSSVINELHKLLVPPRGLFAAGKFDQYKRDIPYSTLAQALQGLVRPLLGKTDAELARWRRSFLEAFEQNGQLMVDLVPDLRLIIGDQPDVPEMPPQQAQARFQRVFRNFIGVFARPEHPLALFLDDLQWLDAATLDLIEDVLTRSDLRHLILIGAYRDNEVDTAHPLVRKLFIIKATGVKVQEITLAPLGREHIAQLIADTMHCAPIAVAPLAQLVLDKTGGNPFFAIQFISALADEGMLYVDHVTGRWSWDFSRITAKGFTDNIVHLMIGKLARLPEKTRRAVQNLACVGNVADLSLLATAFGVSRAQVEADLWEAVRLELVERRKDAYAFVHDRIYEASYSLIPENARAPIHLRIGRLLVDRTTPEQRQETIFEIVNQLNRGSALIEEDDERARLAELNLIAARRAKTSTAYVSACAYLRFGMALLGDEAWKFRRELASTLWLERAECEYLSGDFDEAERRIAELLTQAGSKIDKAAAYRIRIDLQVMRSEHVEAIDTAIECLRLFDIELSPHPPRAEMDAAYAQVLHKLDGRRIESLVSLPRLTDPNAEAAMTILATMCGPAMWTDSTLSVLQLCHMVVLALDHGVTGASAPGFAAFGIMLGHVYGRYEEGYRFAQLARALVARHGLAANEAMALWALELVSLWTQPVSTAVEAIRAAFESGVKSGDIPVACYCCNHIVSNLLLRGDRLEEVWTESERSLAFARRAGYRDVVDVITAQRRFMLTMRGLTESFGSFGAGDFDESEYERSLTSDRATIMICWYWIIKGQARFLAGDLAVAHDCFERAAPLLWASPGHIQLLDYELYAGLTLACLEPELPDVGADVRRARLLGHCGRLATWAESCPSTFADKHALLRAEIARLDGHDTDAMRFYEVAVRSARVNGFPHYEGLAYELAARFYRARGYEEIADLYLRNARRCYALWGADGKVRQLDETNPHFRPLETASASSNTIGTPVEHLDLATVMKVLQSIAGEMVLEKLLDTLMRTALEQAGAERGLLILARAAEPRIAARAAVAGPVIRVDLPDESVDPAALPQSVLQYVLRTHDAVILSDAALEAPFAGDAYVREHRLRSALCVPLINQGKLIGALYLENNLAPRAFVAARIAVLKLIASQAAISLENTQLYRDLEQREARIRSLVDANIIGVFFWDFEGRILDANNEFLRIVGRDRTDLASGSLRWTDITPSEWLTRDQELWVPELRRIGTTPPFEKEFLHKGGTRVPVLMGVALLEGNQEQGTAFVLDLSEYKRAEAEAIESDRRYREAQTDLARANRISTMGHLTASIAHEVRQPLTATIGNAQAGMRWLDRAPPDIKEVRKAFTAIVKDAARANDIVNRIHDMVRKAPPRVTQVNVNTVVREVIELTRSETNRHRALVEARFAEQLPLVTTDRIQLQQVMLNLILNAVEAIGSVEDDPREVLIRTAVEGAGVIVTVCDTGPGLQVAEPEQVFEAFYTTKSGGFGLGLSICRSIVESYGGRLWAMANQPRGTTFLFTLPASISVG
ncbi:trifunctional serine/threonine-protein kinase/ATP-binding protein/sensor histidine kinase [Bradyrhizobium oligotrophicum]|uniref:trifunctional serine/threonine-protein kinase/ATP-binding protein/sensor histidine kinase n=1 Tax=Bradyrhizobium oligotrophicum TaxID=44255 RepID=UPI003EBBDC6A